jgi:hypothetical protein
MRSTRALFVVNEVLDRKDKEGQVMTQIVRMNPSYESNPDSPNHAFWQATPTGSLEMQINNEQVFDFFRPGKSYWLDFSEADS